MERTNLELLTEFLENYIMMLKLDTSANLWIKKNNRAKHTPNLSIKGGVKYKSTSDHISIRCWNKDDIELIMCSTGQGVLRFKTLNEAFQVLNKSIDEVSVSIKNKISEGRI